MRMLPVAILALAVLILSGLLWSQRPGPTFWLLGTLALGVGWPSVSYALSPGTSAGAPK